MLRPQTRRAISHLACLPLAIASLSSPRSAAAQGEPPSTVASRSPRSKAEAPKHKTSLSLIEHLPSSTPVAVIIGTPLRFLEHVKSHAAILNPEASSLGGRALFLGLEQVLGGAPDAARWRAIGIDGDRSVLIIPKLSGESALVRFGLSDRRRFEAWLGRMVGADRTSVSIGRERAIVLFPESELPVICLLRLDHAFCQVGVGEDDEPAADLRTLITGAWKPMSRQGEIARSLHTLDADADAYLIVQPQQIARIAERAWLEHTRRSLRFHHGAAKQRAARLAQRRADQLSSVLEHGRFAVASIDLDRAQPQLELELDLDPAGARWVAATVRAPSASDPVRDWASTPALARVVLNLSEQAARELVTALGLPIAPEQVDGRLAALALGIDSECSAAKTETEDAASYLVMLPFAAAVGLKASTDAKPMSTPRAWLGSVPWKASEEPRVWRGEHLGSPIEARIHDRVLLFGAGHGAGRAAERRWASSHNQVGEAKKSDAFLDADIDLAAVRAAMSSVRLGPNSRDELQKLEQASDEWSAWLETYRSIVLSAAQTDGPSRLRIELGFHP